MFRKAKINNMLYHEDYNVLELDVTWYDNSQNQRLIIRAGETTPEKASENCKKCIGKDINFDMNSDYMDLPKEVFDKIGDKQLDHITKSFRDYPYAETVAILKKERPEDFPEEDENNSAPAWYVFPEEKDCSIKQKKKIKIKKKN